MNTSKRFSLLIFVLILNSCIQDYAINYDNSPKGNFELLWKTVNENYCFFEQNGIDWDAIRMEYEKKITANTDEKELFNICSTMLNELKDGHVNLYSDFNTSRYWDWFLDYPQNFNWPLVERNYLGKECIIAGRLKAKNIKGVGYLRYESFNDNISFENVREAVDQLGSIKGLIIDIRDNGGGYVEMANLFASCFFSKKTIVGYLKYKEGPGHSDFSVFFPQYIEPGSASVYDGEIAILTNRLVFSSANDFVSMMKTLPNVTVIGDVTGGGGGTPFSSELFNGWKVRISRDPMFNVQKESIEAGIVSDIAVSISPEDEQNGIDTIIEFALNYLSKQ